MVDKNGATKTIETNVVAKHPIDMPFNQARLELASIVAGRPLSAEGSPFSGMSAEQAKEMLQALTQRGGMDLGDMIEKLDTLDAKKAEKAPKSQPKGKTPTGKGTWQIEEVPRAR